MLYAAHYYNYIRLLPFRWRNLVIFPEFFNISYSRERQARREKEFSRSRHGYGQIPFRYSELVEESNKIVLFRTQ